MTMMRAKQTKAPPRQKIDEVELLYQKVAFMRDEVNRRWGHERLKKLSSSICSISRIGCFACCQSGLPGNISVTGPSEGITIPGNSKQQQKLVRRLGLD
jgi:hypothetical protein